MKKIVGSVWRLILLASVLAGWVLLTYVLGQAYFDSQVENIEIDANEFHLGNNHSDYTLSLINDYRDENGLDALDSHTRLCEFAKYRIETSTFESGHAGFQDVINDPSLFEFNNEFYVLGENLAGDTFTPEATVRGWKDSPPHNELLLDETMDFGCVAINEDASYYVLITGDVTFRR